MKNDLLYKSFENIPTRRGRGGTYSYIRWQEVADRMNEAFGTSWSSEVKFQEIIGNNVIVRVRVSVTDPSNNLTTIQEGFGGAPNDANSEAGNPFKAAYSKALKDACKKWGVGLYLDEDDEPAGGNMTPPSLPSGYIGKELGVPPSSLMTPPSMDIPKMPEDNNYTEVASPSIPSAPPIGGIPLPSSVTMASSNTVVVSEEPVMVNMEPIASNPIPPIPKVSMISSLPTPPGITMNKEMPTSKTNVIITGEPDFISDVQKAALQSILNIKGVEYEALAKEAFEFNGYVKDPIPESGKLTYQEAVYVIKYGNDKFRKR